MARHLFPGDTVWLLFGVVAAGLPFKFFDDLVAGNEITDVVGIDGQSAVELVTDQQGNRPTVRGPDSATDGSGAVIPAMSVLFCDTGADQRFPVYAVDETEYVLDNFRRVAVQLAELQSLIDAGGVGTGGGLPANLTLDSVKNSETRLAMTLDERVKLSEIAAGATRLLLGNTKDNAKAGNWMPTPGEVGAVANRGGFAAVWGRNANEGLPTLAEGLKEGDWTAVVNP
jgi:hypothetical protein